MNFRAGENWVLILTLPLPSGELAVSLGLSFLSRGKCVIVASSRGGLQIQ